MAYIDELGNLVKKYKRPWSDGERQLHIFIREVIAAERGITLLRSLIDLNDETEIWLVIDNTSAAWALQRGYTANTRAMAAIMSIIDLHRAWRVVTVVSEDNCADEPSRNRLVKPDRLLRTLKCVEEVVSGRKSGCIVAENPARGQIRHTEPANEVRVDKYRDEVEEDICLDHASTIGSAFDMNLITSDEDDEETVRERDAASDT